MKGPGKSRALKLIRSDVWDTFSETVRQRLARAVRAQKYDYTLSEENFRLDFAVALSRRWNYSEQVFAEYPTDKVPSQKLDLFLDAEYGGVAFEFKFFRDFPSQRLKAMTRYRGDVWADLIKLGLLCSDYREKVFVIFATKRLLSHFKRFAMFDQAEGETRSLEFVRAKEVKTVMAQIQKRLKKFVIPERLSFRVTTHRTFHDDASFGGFLLQLHDLSAGSRSQ